MTYRKILSWGEHRNRVLAVLDDWENAVKAGQFEESLRRVLHAEQTDVTASATTDLQTFDQRS